MHEMALCTNVSEVVLAEAKRANAVKVNEVHMIVGEVRDIVEDLFCGFFEHMARGTVAEGTKVVFTRVPATAACKDCGTAFPLDLHAHRMGECPKCGASNYTLAAGNEFIIASIDITTQEELQAIA